MNKQLLDVAVNKGRPIPGQSLTNDPSNPAPYEKPPKFTSIHAASEHIFSRFIQRDVYVNLMAVLDDGIPIMDITQTVLFKGFTEGKWTPDLMMLLVEPTAYMLLALSERAGIEPVIYRGEEDDEAEDMRIGNGPKISAERLEKIKALKKRGIVPSEVMSAEMVAQMEQLPTEEETQSLLAQQPAVVPQEGESLMAPPAEEVVQ